MSAPDPDFWREASKFLWAGLALPIAHVWRKTNGAVQKEDFREYAKEVKDVIEKHAEQDEQTRKESRETFLKIFERLEKQGEVLNKVDATVTFLREKR